MVRRLTFGVAITAILLCVSATAAEPTKKQAVLVTGASSGIGLMITEYLSERDFHVYAGARKEKDLERLNGMENVSSVRLDVTKQDDIDAAVEFVVAEGRGLFGIINNAGVASIEPMSSMDEGEVTWMHEVNVLGPVRVNKAFLPLLKDSRGRTAIIGSISGYVTGPTAGGYSMSKFAVEAYTESLAMDLADSGVSVGIIDPGAFRSRIREKVAMRAMTGSDDLDQTLSDEQQANVDNMKANNAQLKEPYEVAEAAVHFITSDSPRLRYMVPPTKDSADRAIRTTLDRVLQLNHGQPYELSRDELVAILDEIIETRDGAEE